MNSQETNDLLLEVHSSQKDDANLKPTVCNVIMFLCFVYVKDSDKKNVTNEENRIQKVENMKLLNKFI